MVVGDDAQSIYAWRGANYENILKFPKRYPEAKVYKIETNYRSTPEILDAANAVIAANTQQFTKLLAMDDISLTVTKDALAALAESALKKGTGARALRSLLEKIMLDVMSDAPDREDFAGVTLNRAVVEGRKSALIRRRQEKDAA